VAFKGWPGTAVAFFDGLEADNSRSYWQANKQTYDECVRAPMEELLAELAKEFGEARIFRPNRDTRFSLDKSPYKTSIAAHFNGRGYVHYSADRFGAGSGMYMMAADQLERYRRAVDDDRSGRALERLVAKVRAAGIEVTAHDELKTAPRGYAKDHPRIAFLRLKGLVAWREWPVGKWTSTAEPKQRVIEVLRAAKPLNKWLDEHVGASDLPER
jgi:uncharacterized protein (TIGR02453 family)